MGLKNFLVSLIFDLMFTKLQDQPTPTKTPNARFAFHYFVVYMYVDMWSLFLLLQTTAVDNIALKSTGSKTGTGSSLLGIILAVRNSVWPANN